MTTTIQKTSEVPGLVNFLARPEDFTKNPERELSEQSSEVLRAINPSGNVFDVWIGPTSTLFFLAEGTKRDTVALTNGDDLLDRFAALMTAKYKGGDMKGKCKKEGKMHEKREMKMEMEMKKMPKPKKGGKK